MVWFQLLQSMHPFLSTFLPLSALWHLTLHCPSQRWVAWYFCIWWGFLLRQIGQAESWFFFSRLCFWKDIVGDLSLRDLDLNDLSWPIPQSHHCVHPLSCWLCCALRVSLQVVAAKCMSCGKFNCMTWPRHCMGLDTHCEGRGGCVVLCCIVLHCILIMFCWEVWCATVRTWYFSNFLFDQFHPHLKTITYLFIRHFLNDLTIPCYDSTILMTFPFHELEQIVLGCYWLQGLNMGQLDDLLLNSILHDLPLSILFVPQQPTVVHQPIKAISHLVGNRQPLGKWQPIPFTQTFLQNSQHPGKAQSPHHQVHISNCSYALFQIRTPRHERNHLHYPCCLSILCWGQAWKIVQGDPALAHIMWVCLLLCPDKLS